MRISELHVYPIKSAAGVTLKRARLDDFGLADDRRWMIVDDHGVFQSQREHPTLTLLEVELEPGALVVRSAPAGEARVTRGQPPGPVTQVRVWDDDVDAIDCGDEVAAIITAHVGEPVRLVYMPDSSIRPVNPDYYSARARVSFADAFPLLLITQESLDELNGRLAQRIPMLRFRPNVVVSGAEPYAEDTWRMIRLGAVPCDVVKPCDRCATTTVDIATGVRGKEPLRTLASYRNWNGKVYFGQNVIHRQPGEMAAGDGVSILESATPRPPL